LHFARLNAQKGWTMQLHIAALRNVNPRLFKAFGPDVGGDSTSDAPIIAPLASLLGALENEGHLPKTILYSLDPSKHNPLAVLAASFAGTSPFDNASQVPGKVLLGAAWWFNDQKDGMERHLKEYAGSGSSACGLGC
jgi:glucuronate isomerase